MGKGIKRAATDSAATTASKKGCLGAMTADCFRASYETKLVDPSLWSVYSSRTWSSIIDSLDLPETLLLSTVKDQLLAFFYVMQPPGVVNQPYIQIWELFKSLLALQAGDGDGDGDGGGQVCLAAVLGEQEGEPDDESEWSNDSEDDVLGYEAALPGDKASGRAEFVLVRAPANSRLPVTHGLNLVTEGATPLLVGEVKPAEKFSDHIWHPLACAVELMEESSDPPQSMWVFLTDAEMWEFVRVDRVPCSATGEGAAVAGAAAAGGAVAGAVLAGSRYSFTRFHTLVASIDNPSTHYLKLLAVLHHIIFPGQRLADLPDRVARSRQALEARAGEWVKIVQKQFQDDVEKVKALEADNAKLKAELKEAELKEAELKATNAELEATHAELEATVAKFEAAMAGQGGGQQQAR